MTVQGQITFRVADPGRTAMLLNFTIGPKGTYVSEDPQKLSQRLIDQVQVAMRAEVQVLPLKDVLASGEALVDRVLKLLRSHPTIEALGLELLGLSLLAVKPKPDTAKALEAEAREALLRRADEAIYARRNAAVEQERTIKENELATEIAVENKKRQVREAQMEAERSVQERRLQIQREQMTGKIGLEEQNKTLVTLASANQREEADAKAYGIAAMMRSFGDADPKVLQALASVGMDPAQLMALAFRDLADNATKIGQLNVTPDLLREVLQIRRRGVDPDGRRRRPQDRVDRARDPARRADRALQHGPAGRSSMSSISAPTSATTSRSSGSIAPRRSPSRRASAISAGCSGSIGATSPTSSSAPDDIVVALGQDGLVANTLKYLDGQHVLGVNPDPKRWDGVLLPFRPQDLAKVMPEAIAGRRPLKRVTMAKATLNTGEVLYAVNDLFIGPRSAHLAPLHAAGRRPRGAPVLERDHRLDRPRLDRLAEEPLRRLGGCRRHPRRRAAGPALDAVVPLGRRLPALLRPRAFPEPHHRRLAGRRPDRRRPRR